MGQELPALEFYYYTIQFQAAAPFSKTACARSLLCWCSLLIHITRVIWQCIFCTPRISAARENVKFVLKSGFRILGDSVNLSFPYLLSACMLLSSHDIKELKKHMLKHYLLLEIQSFYFCNPLPHLSQSSDTDSGKILCALHKGGSLKAKRAMAILTAIICSMQIGATLPCQVPLFVQYNSQQKLK